MTQRLLFDLPAPLAPPPDLSDTYLLPSVPAPLAAPARQLLLAPAATEHHLPCDSWQIPARCPVTGDPTCHRDGCYHFHAVDGGRCSHPQAGKP